MLVLKTSFRGETSVTVAKSRLFSQATFRLSSIFLGATVNPPETVNIAFAKLRAVNKVSCEQAENCELFSAIFQRQYEPF